MIAEQRKAAETQRTQREAVPWFNAERVDLLQLAAATWIGTPFFPNGRVKGSGVSCQMFAPMLYEEVGFLPKAIVDAIPDGPMDWARANKESLIAKHIDVELREYFEEVPAACVGDLLGFEIGACVQHLGVLLRNGFFIHVFRTPAPRIMSENGVHYSRMDDATYAQRLKRIWRPIEIVYGS